MRTSRDHRGFAPGVLGLALLTAVTGCGNSSEGAATSRAARAEASAIAAAGASGATSAGVVPSPGTDGPTPAYQNPDLTGDFLCGVIKKVQADLPAGTNSASYGAEWVLGISGLITGDVRSSQDFAERADSLAKARCPTEYATFLAQSKLTSLARI